MMAGEALASYLLYELLGSNFSLQDVIERVFPIFHIDICFPHSELIRTHSEKFYRAKVLKVLLSLKSNIS